MRRSRVILGIVILSLILSSAPAHADTGTGKVEMVSVYEFTKQYYTETKDYNIFGVKVTLELTFPRLVIDGENQTLTFRIRVGDAPSDWLLNITKLTILVRTLTQDCMRESVQKIATVLRGGESLTKQFTIKREAKINPGEYLMCYLKVNVEYSAKFGANLEEKEMSIVTRIPIKAKELPLEIRPNIYITVKKDLFLAFETFIVNLIGQITIRNAQNQDVVLSRAYLCDLTKPGEIRYYNEGLISPFCQSPAINKQQREISATVKPGGEYVLSINETQRFFEEPPWELVYVIKYFYPNGNAENWIIFRISDVTIVRTTTQEKKSPTTITTPKATPTATITKTEATVTRATRAETIILTATTPSAGAPSSDFTLALILVPIVVAAATATVFAVRWLRKAPT